MLRLTQGHTRCIPTITGRRRCTAQDERGHASIQDSETYFYSGREEVFRNHLLKCIISIWFLQTSHSILSSEVSVQPLSRCLDTDPQLLQCCWGLQEILQLPCRPRCRCYQAPRSWRFLSTLTCWYSGKWVCCRRHAKKYWSVVLASSPAHYTVLVNETPLNTRRCVRWHCMSRQALKILLFHRIGSRCCLTTYVTHIHIRHALYRYLHRSFVSR